MEPLDPKVEQPTAEPASLSDNLSPMGSHLSTNAVIVGAAAADPTSTPATEEATMEESSMSKEPKDANDGGPSDAAAGAAEDSMELELASPAQVEKPSISSNGPGSSELTDLSVDDEEGKNKLDDNAEDSVMEPDKELDEVTTPMDVSEEPVESAVVATVEDLGSDGANQEEKKPVAEPRAGEHVQFERKRKLSAHKSVHSSPMPMSRTKLSAAKSTGIQPTDSYAEAGTYVDTEYASGGSASLENVEDEKVMSTPPSYTSKRIHASKSVILTPPFRSHSSVPSESSGRRKRAAMKSVISGLVEPIYETNEETDDDDDGDEEIVRPLKNKTSNAVPAAAMPKKKTASKKVNQKNDAALPKKKTASKKVNQTKVPKPAAKTSPLVKTARLPAAEVSSGFPGEPLEGGWPPGWVKKVFERRSGATKGGHDRYWYSPLTSKKFRSMVEVKRYMKALRDCGGNEDMAWKWFKGKV